MTSPPSPDIQVLGNCALEIDFQSGQVDFQGGQVDFQSGQVVRPETQHTSPGGGGASMRAALSLSTPWSHP